MNTEDKDTVVIHASYYKNSKLNIPKQDDLDTNVVIIPCEGTAGEETESSYVKRIRRSRESQNKGIKAFYNLTF